LRCCCTAAIDPCSVAVRHQVQILDNTLACCSTMTELSVHYALSGTIMIEDVTTCYYLLPCCQTDILNPRHIYLTGPLQLANNQMMSSCGTA